MTTELCRFDYESGNPCGREAIPGGNGGCSNAHQVALDREIATCRDLLGVDPDDIIPRRFA